MERFFEKLNSVIGKEGKARMLIAETNGELIVTFELWKGEKEKWTSPAQFRSHPSVLDDNLLNDLEKGLVQIRPYLKDTQKMVDSVKPKDEAKTPVDKKNEAPAKPETKKAETKTVKAPEPEKPKPAETTINMFAQEQAEKSEQAVETEDAVAEVIETTVKEDASGLAEASGVIADTKTGEITHTIVNDYDFGSTVKPIEVVKPDYETELGRLRGLNKDGKFQEAIDGLKALLVHYPNDPAILMGIEKITAKLPPPTPVVEDF